MLMAKLLKLTNDYVFKRIFGYVGDEEVTKVLLRDILQTDINDIKLDNNTITEKDLLESLTYLNMKGDTCVRILHEVRTKKRYTNESVDNFVDYVQKLEGRFSNIKFWCGKNLYNWENDYNFWYTPSCEEKYSSVCPPKILDDWWPWLYARLNNKKIIKEGTDKDILLIDFVEYVY